MKHKKLTMAGMFSGIGGFELGFQRAGYKTSILCEIEPTARRVLTENFPNHEIVNDIRDINFVPSNVDVLCAGFPCQNLSSSGSKAGIEGDQSSLVYEVFRILRKRPVEWVILENVAFMLKLKSGQAIRAITAAFEELGYRWAYRVIDSSVFVPQRRRRIYIVASLNHDPRNVLLSDNNGLSGLNSAESMDTPVGFYWTEGRYALGLANNAIPPLKAGSTIGIASPPAIAFPNGFVGTPDIRDAERLQGFDVDWTASACDVAKPAMRWRLVGNAVTVNIAEWLANRIANPALYDSSADDHINFKRGWPNAGWSMGSGAYEANINEWPVKMAHDGIDSFLRYELKPLSVKATSGFLKRVRAGGLRVPEGFIELLNNHSIAMEGENTNA
jgi:DNA (cytosine-5)-methyltransferase 1